MNKKLSATYRIARVNGIIYGVTGVRLTGFQIRVAITSETGDKLMAFQGSVVAITSLNALSEEMRACRDC